MMSNRKSYIKHWPRKNLGELINFIEKQYPNGYTLKQLADTLDMKIQYISAVMLRDDIKLSTAENIARKYGYTLKLFFPQREYCYTGTVRMKDYPNAGNLKGLVKYLIDSNISINYMSQRINKSNNVLTNAFTKGDIMVSTLYEIVKNLNIDVIWNFDKTTNN